jgi:hypothetical protein
MIMKKVEQIKNMVKEFKEKALKMIAFAKAKAMQIADLANAKIEVDMLKANLKILQKNKMLKNRSATGSTADVNKNNIKEAK